MRALLAALTLVGWASTAEASPSVTVETDSRSVTLGETFTVRFVVKTEDRGEGRFDEPSWRQAKVVGRSKQSRMQIVNRQVSRSLIYDFQIRAEKPGVLVISGARYTDRTGTGRSRPINVKVGVAQAPDVPTPTRDGSIRLDGAEVALVATVDRDKVYKGEQFKLTYTLYTRVRISEYAMDDPELPGFWKEDLSSPRQPKFHRRVVDGQAYDAAVVKRYLLLPLQEGARFVPSVRLSVEKQISTFRTRTLKLRSNSINLQVKPLPPGAPKGFSGAVGRFKAKVSVDRKQGRVGQPVAVRIELAGQGNLKHFKLPLPKPPDGIRAHPPTVDDKVGIKGGRMRGKKVVEWILTPERAGRFSLGAIRVPYFDPRAGAYRTAVASPVALKVLPSKKGPAATPADTSKPSSASVAEAPKGPPSLRPLKTDFDLRPGRGERPSRPWRTAGFWIVFGLPPLAWLLLLLLDRIRAKRSDSSEERVMRGALRRARRRLHDARDYAQEGRTETLYGELARLLIGYIDDRTAGRTAGLSFHELREHLMAAGYEVRDADEIMAVLEHCDQARFMPGGAEVDEMRASMERVEALLRRLDTHAPFAEGSSS